MFKTRIYNLNDYDQTIKIIDHNESWEIGSEHSRTIGEMLEILGYTWEDYRNGIRWVEHNMEDPDYDTFDPFAKTTDKWWAL